MSTARIMPVSSPCIALKPKALSSTGKLPQVYAKPGWLIKDSMGLNLRRSEFRSAKLTYSPLTVSTITLASELVKESIDTKSDLLDLLNTVLHQAEKTTVNASEITLCEDVVSSKHEALKTKNSRSCHMYEKIIRFFHIKAQICIILSRFLTSIGSNICHWGSIRQYTHRSVAMSIDQASGS